MRKIKQQQPIWGAGHSTAHALLVAGEFKILGEGYIHHVLQSHKKGAPVDWSRVSPVVVTGSSFTLQKKAPHPNAARLFLEWQLSNQGLPAWAEVSHHYVSTVTSPMSRLLEGRNLIVRTEEVVLKGIEMGLIKRFNKTFFGIED